MCFWIIIGIWKNILVVDESLFLLQLIHMFCIHDYVVVAGGSNAVSNFDKQHLIWGKTCLSIVGVSYREEDNWKTL